MKLDGPYLTGLTNETGVVASRPANRQTTTTSAGWCGPSGSDGFVAFTAAEVAARPGRPLPGRDADVPLPYLKTTGTHTFAESNPAPATQIPRA